MAVNTEFKNKTQTTGSPSPRPGGMTDEMYPAFLRDSRVPPAPPTIQRQKAIPSNNDGDKDYQMDEEEKFTFSPKGREEFQNFREQVNPETGEPNSLWYNEDGSRTDYAGKYAPSLSEQRELAARNAGGAANIPDPNSPIPGGTYNADGTSNYGSDPIDLGDVGGTTTEDTTATTTEDATTTEAPEPTERKLEKGTEFKFTKQEVGEGELGTAKDLVLDDPVKVSKDNLEILSAELKELGIPNVNLIDPLPELEAVLGKITDEDLIKEVTSEVTERYKEAEAEARRTITNFKAFEGSTVKEQFAMLQDDWVGVDGKSKIPFYARGAITAAKQSMAARGMGASSMASVAITQAGLEAMMPVAMADAQFMQTLSVKSFDSQTAIGMAKLAHISMLDQKDLDFKQQRAVNTANKFFQMNMDNVSAERAVEATNNANEVQKLFSDAAAKNVATNLGYTTEAEMVKFYDQLEFQAAESTARLLLDADKFNASAANARDEFNATLKKEIERDNINYLRSINTANTAGINQQNLTNSQNLLKISNTEIANKLTLQRDRLTQIFTASQNAEARANNYAIAQLTADASTYRVDAAIEHQNSQQLGAFVMGTLKGPLEDFAKWSGDSIAGLFNNSTPVVPKFRTGTNSFGQDFIDT